MLVTTPGLSEFISGVILFDETVRQRMSHGIPMSIPKVLVEQGIIPGIKVDKGTASLTNFPGERLTQGLDGLRERLAEYRELGAGFTKWRAVITIGEHLPTRTCIKANANALALFAAEAFVTSHGLLTLGGLACLITGGVMLVDSPAGFLRVSLWVLIPIALATAAITASSVCRGRPGTISGYAMINMCAPVVSTT